MIVIADTSGLLAMFNRSEPEHFAVRRAADSASTLVASPLALTEVHQVASVRSDRKTADRIVALLADRIASTRLVLGEVDAGRVRAAIHVRSNYAGLNLDIVDAMCVVLAADFDTDTILTLDRRDFRAMRPLGNSPAFRLLPDDMSE